MTDTAIPIPENLHAVMMPGVEAALAAVLRAWAPVVEEVERASAAGSATSCPNWPCRKSSCTDTRHTRRA